MEISLFWAQILNLREARIRLAPRKWDLDDPTLSYEKKNKIWFVELRNAKLQIEWFRALIRLNEGYDAAFLALIWNLPFRGFKT